MLHVHSFIFFRHYIASLFTGLASGQFTFQSLQQQMNQPNKRSADIIRSVLNYATTIAGQAYLHSIQLIHQLSNNKNKGNNGSSSNNTLINHNNSGSNHLHSLNNRKFEQLNQHHLQQVQLQMQRQGEFFVLFLSCLKNVSWVL